MKNPTARQFFSNLIIVLSMFTASCSTLEGGLKVCANPEGQRGARVEEPGRGTITVPGGGYYQSQFQLPISLDLHLRRPGVAAWVYAFPSFRELEVSPSGIGTDVKVTSQSAQAGFLAEYSGRKFYYAEGGEQRIEEFQLLPGECRIVR